MKRETLKEFWFRAVESRAISGVCGCQNGTLTLAGWGGGWCAPWEEVHGSSEPPRRSTV